MNWVTIGPGNGLAPIRRQTITRTNNDVLLMTPLGTNANEILIKINLFLLVKSI